MSEKDEYRMQITDNKIRIHNVSAEARAKKRELLAYRSKLKAKKAAKRKKREQRKAKAKRKEAER